MNLTKAKQLHGQLSQSQWFELCNDWLDEKDIMFSIKNKMIPELAFQGICRESIPESAVLKKIKEQTISLVV